MSLSPNAEPDARRQLVSLPLAVVLLAPDQLIAGANPAAEQFFGQSLRRLAGRPLAEALRFADPRVAERLRPGDAPLSARQVDVSVVGQGGGQGGLRRLDITLAPVTDHAGWQMLTLQGSAAAEALGGTPHPGDNAVLRAPEVLAHEIKNPLAGIRGAAQLLARKLNAKDAALTILIADEVDRIAKLIDQMQTLSRRTPEPLGPCNLHEAVRHACAIVGAADGGEGGGVRIAEAFDPSLPPVLGSQHALVQVLINLLANAREACKGVPQPRILVRTRFASGLQLHGNGGDAPVRLPIELRVSDNGSGIDPAVRDHIFEPFVTTKTTGQGLGLALVRKLVRDMNGRITHDREEGREAGGAGWTHFRVHLQQAQKGTHPHQESPYAASPHASNPRPEQLGAP